MTRAAAPVETGVSARRRAARFAERLAFAALAVAPACAGDTADRRLDRVRVDTVGGVVHVRNPAPEATAALEPVITIGRMGGVGEPRPDEFGQVRSVVADAEGKIYVADTQADEIRVFAADGGFLHRIGRSGAGPGEFNGLYGLGWLGDTLVALDVGNARIQLLDGRGEPVGTRLWYRLTGSPSYVRLYPVGRDEVYAPAVLPGAAQGVRPFLRLTHAGADTIRVIYRDPPRHAGVRCDQPDGGISFFEVPFAPQFLFAPAPDGGMAVVAWSDRYRIAIHDASGDTVRVIERAHAPVPVGDREWADAMTDWERYRAEVPGARCDAGFWRPDHKPAISAIFFDQEGRLVVEASGPDGPVLDFYDAAGALRASVAAPARGDREVPYFRADHIYLPVADSLGVQRIRVWRARG